MTALILLKNETIKTTRRVAFWVTVLAFSAITTLMMLDLHQASQRTKDPRPFALPSGWWGILDDAPAMAMFFGSVILMLLVASEFSWRTARQNVIDGLSKEQFFAGKLMLLPMVGLALFAIPLIAGPPIAMIGEGLPTAGWVTTAQVQFMGSLVLGIVGTMSIAFLFASTIRSTGSALGAFILYIAFVERIAGMLVGWMNPAWAPAGRYFPALVFQALLDAERWQPGFGAGLKPGQLPPVPTDRLVGFGVGYILLLWLVSFLLFRRRDL